MQQLTFQIWGVYFRFLFLTNQNQNKQIKNLLDFFFIWNF